MKEQTSIPVGKVQRASKFLATGAKVGSNYLKYYGKKIIKPDTDRSSLDRSNAEDIYESLSELKGSVLKAAQMLSMDQGMLPTAYAEKFQMAQYSAPPLSFPLVAKTFRRYFGRTPDQMFDMFEQQAANAASIGQVHKASKDGKSLAVKVQYPGVADSVRSDLKLAMPFAARIMNLKVTDLTEYVKEVESKLLEETNYKLELERSMDLTVACGHMEDLVFAQYYPEWSSARILTMDWLEGKHLKEWLATDPDIQTRNRIGQALWDFYSYQMHVLRIVHADPHPGNFLITADNRLAVLDFGCVKEVPDEFYTDYFKLMYESEDLSTEEIEHLFERLAFLLPTDTLEERTYIFQRIQAMLNLLGKPFRTTQFDFGNEGYFSSIYTFADEMMQDKKLRSMNNARGSRHGIYINRTFFGLYSLLHELKATVHTHLPQAKSA